MSCIVLLLLVLCMSNSGGIVGGGGINKINSFSLVSKIYFFLSNYYNLILYFQNKFLIAYLLNPFTNY
jgi:hypothetical protein